MPVAPGPVFEANLVRRLRIVYSIKRPARWITEIKALWREIGKSIAALARRGSHHPTRTKKELGAWTPLN
jgi:hypothetical protein